MRTTTYAHMDEHDKAVQSDKQADMVHMGRLTVCVTGPEQAEQIAAVFTQAAARMRAAAEAKGVAA